MSDIRVEVVYALPERQYLRTVKLEQGSNVEQALLASGLLELRKDIDLKKSVPFIVMVLIALAIAAINIHAPSVLFAAFSVYALSGYGVYAWRKAKGVPTSVIALSKDEPDEQNLHSEF